MNRKRETGKISRRDKKALYKSKAHFFIMTSRRKLIACGEGAMQTVAWATSFEFTNRIVEQTAVGNLDVSTVFLGMNHQWFPGRPPLLFETMIFGEGSDCEQWRYSTYQQAKKGHQRAIRYAERMNG